MTVVVGIETPTGVVIGTDGQLTGRDGLVAPTERKLWQAGGLVYGFSGDADMLQKLRDISFQHEYHLMEEVDSFLSEHFTDESLKESDWAMLVGAPHELWYVDSVGCIDRSLNGWNAIGAGAGVATGVLVAYQLVLDPPVPDVTWVESAIAICCEQSAWCGGPVMTMENVLELQ